MSFQQQLLFSWKTSLLGVAGFVLAVIQATNDTTIPMLIHDQKFWFALLIAGLGFLAKDNTAHGTPSAPIPPAQAAVTAAIAVRATPPTPPLQ